MKFKKLLIEGAEKDNSDTHKYIIAEKQNRAWTNISKDIALKILSVLRKNKQTQKSLAETLKVSEQHISKIVKGSENLTLETITYISTAINTKLIYSSYEYEELAEKVELLEKQLRFLSDTFIIKTYKYSETEIVKNGIVSSDYNSYEEKSATWSIDLYSSSNNATIFN